MSPPIVDQTDTALVRFFRNRPRLFHGLLALSIGLAAGAFIFVPLIRRMLP